MNLEAAREQYLGKHVLRERYEDHRDPRTYFQRAVENTGGPCAPITSDQLKRRIDEHDLGEARDDRADLVTSIGYGHWTETSALAPLLRRFEECFAKHGPVLEYHYPHKVTPHVELDNLATRTCAVLARVVHSAMRMGASFTVDTLAYELYLQYQDVVYGPSILADLRRYAYRSAASKVGQTYLSSFSDRHRPPGYTSDTRAVAQFVVEYCIRYRQSERMNTSDTARGGD